MSNCSCNFLLVGPYDQGGLCSTCQQTFLFCPGHFGRIELPLPVINPLFSKTMLLMCRMSCLECHSVTVPGPIKYLTITMMRLLNDGLLKEAQEAEFIIADILISSESVGAKKKGNNRSADEQISKRKFKEYLQDIYKERNKGMFE